MPSLPRRSLPLVLTCLAVLTSGVAGCSTERGRIDTYKTTDNEKRSDQVLTTALLEFSDQVPERLIQDLYELPEVSDQPGKVIVLIGDFNNKTQIVPTTDFEMVAQRIRNQLINSKTARDKLTFTEKRSRVERLSADEKVVGVDGAPAEAAAYQGESTFFLLGDFYRTNRANTNLYYMQFQLVSPTTNTIVFSDSYDVKQAN